MPQSELSAALDAGGSENLSFPGNIAELDHWLCLRVNKPVFRKKDDFPVRNDKKRIFLPMPLNLATAYGHDYNADSIGAFGVAAGDMAMKAGGAQGIASFVDKAINNPGGTTKEALKSLGIALPKMQDALKNADYEALAKKAGSSAAAPTAAFGAYLGAAAAATNPIGKGILGASGVARNPYMAVLYNQPKFREHQFSWKLVAKNYKESKMIFDIIHDLKFYAAPKRLNGTLQFFYEYPHQFDIDFHYDDYLFNIAPSVLTNIEVNYHAEGQPLYFQNSSTVGEEEDEAGGIDIKTEKLPTSVQLTLNFQEISVITKDEIEKNKR